MSHPSKAKTPAGRGGPDSSSPSGALPADGASLAAPVGGPPVDGLPASEDPRVGIDRAFDVIRNHTVHTKGYVMTALKLIEEFGDHNDKASLQALLRDKQQQSPASSPSSAPPTQT